MKRMWLVSGMAVLFLALILVATTSAQVNLLPLNPYSQDFDTLASTGTSSDLPPGWFLSESGTNANITYTAGTGSDNTGDTYSFGATGSSERALGGLLSGSVTPRFGAGFFNNTGRTIGQLLITYTCEQWRLGATARLDRLDFQYSTNATSLSTGTWIDFNALDCRGPITAGTVGELDGNAISNQVTLTANISGTLSVPNGSTFWVRWTDFNASGADDGLAVDDFSLNLFSPTAVTTNSLSASNTTAAPFAFFAALSVMIGAGVVIAQRKRKSVA